MNDYMRALHQRFFQEPEYTELEERIESARQEVRDCLDQLHRRKLMDLIDTQNVLCDEISLASFTAGFKLAIGIAKELEADGLYSFDQEQTDRICHQIKEEGGEVKLWQKTSNICVPLFQKPCTPSCASSKKNLGRT